MQAPLSETQRRHKDSAVKYLSGGKQTGKPYRALTGFAGTGKTRTMKEVYQGLLQYLDPSEIALMAPTWRAAGQLTDSVGVQATSIHRRVYRAPEKEGRQLRFGAIQPRGSVKAAIVDESSMIGTKVAKDLIDFMDGYPLLAVGDKGQLQPIKDKWGFDLDKADYQLTEVFRQAQDSPIIGLSMAVREGRPFNFKAANPEQLYYCSTTIKRLVELVKRRAEVGKFVDNGRAIGAVIVCYTNEERRMINDEWRAQEGRPRSVQVGERLLSFSNTLGLFNGDLVTVEAVSQPFLASNETLDIEPNEFGLLVSGFPAVAVRLEGDFPSLDKGGARWGGNNFPVDYREYTHILAVDSLNNPVPRRLGDYGKGVQGQQAFYVTRAGLALADCDFGYGVTCHKMQGSQAKVVGVWRGPALNMMDPNERVRWDYTAFTRAQESLIVGVPKG